MKPYLDGLRQAVDAELLRGLDPRRGTLAAAMHYALSISGKRLRPLLFLSLLDGLEIESRRHVDVAAAIEIIHTYSLIHDDLPCMDNDDLRRGQPTVHKRFNEAVALLAGDTLLTFAFEKIASSDLPPRRITAIMRLITASIGLLGMAGGQALDLEFRGEVRLIEDIHRLKTAALIRATLLSAAEIATLNRSRRAHLERAGTAIGLAFQLADDLLDVSGDEAEVGKKLHKDGDNRSPNAALFLGLDEVRRRIDLAYAEAMDRIAAAGIDHPPLLQLFREMAYRSR
jgi:geranylgeranyl pyrophosphate synthase